VILAQSIGMTLPSLSWPTWALCESLPRVRSFPVQHIESESIPPARPYGPRVPVGEPRTCRGCARPIDPEQRAHVCKACRLRKCRGTTVGSACACCGHAVRAELVRRNLADGSVTLCGNCATRCGRRPLTLAQLRGERAA